MPRNTVVAASVYTDVMPLQPPSPPSPDNTSRRAVPLDAARTRRRARWRRTIRTAGFMLAVLLLHLIAANWGVRHIDLQAPPDNKAKTASSVVEVTLTAPPPPLPSTVSPMLMRPARRVAHRSHPAAAEPSASAPPVIAAADSSWRVAPPDGSSRVDGSADANSNSAQQSGPNAQSTASLPITPPQPAPRSHLAPPPPVELKYDVTGLREGNTVHGGGKISWTQNGDRYRVVGSASVLFFTLLDFSSEGALIDGALAPEVYTEKRFRKAATQTRFQQPRNTITFSDASNRYADVDNAQDRASIIWQLAAIGRGDPAAFVAGAVFEFFVAGIRDAEPWRLQVVGDQQLDAGDGPMQTWHLVRLPRTGSYDQKIDIWLAPQQYWYPVRIRYTETNGEYLDMTLARLTPLPS